MKKKIFIGILVFIILSIIFLIYNVIVKNTKIKDVKNNNIELGNGIYATVFNTGEGEKFDSNKRKKMIDYDLGTVYFYDIRDVEFEYNGRKLNLKKALLDNIILIEQVIEQAEIDSNLQKNRKDIVKDGGSIKYEYETFSIIKFNTLGGNKDIYIGKKNMDINVLKQGY